MILIDYSGVAISNIMVQRIALDENIIRHMILNSIRMYRSKYKKQFGEIVIVADGDGNWRKDIFPQYKLGRKKSRDESPIDWVEAYRIINMVFDEISENFPYKTMRVCGCEADDVIAKIALETQEFGKHEEVMIVSSDKDFVQLQKYSNIKQYSPINKKHLETKNAKATLMEHVFRGCKSDKVPNILSPDNSFPDGIRQTPMTQKKIDAWMAADDLKSVMNEETYRNYCRNKKLIDLTETPQNIQEDIINTYEAQDPWSNKSKVFPYLVSKRCRLLLECVQEFI
tara:strand:- start:6205 stop:7056 length:852 start_codon:yes stop_codon:yes gene_type:complete